MQVHHDVDDRGTAGIESALEFFCLISKFVLTFMENLFECHYLLLA